MSTSPLSVSVPLSLLRHRPLFPNVRTTSHSSTSPPLLVLCPDRFLLHNGFDSASDCFPCFAHCSPGGYSPSPGLCAACPLDTAAASSAPPPPFCLQCPPGTTSSSSRRYRYDSAGLLVRIEKYTDYLQLPTSTRRRPMATSTSTSLSATAGLFFSRTLLISRRSAPLSWVLSPSSRMSSSSVT